MAWKCRCGQVTPTNVHVDRFFGYAAWSEEYHKFEKAVGRQISEFINAITAGNRDQWIRQRFTDDYPVELEDWDIITDLLSKHNWEYFRAFHQCPNCHRLHIGPEKFENGEWKWFAPEEEP